MPLRVQGGTYMRQYHSYQLKRREEDEAYFYKLLSDESFSSEGDYSIKPAKGRYYSLFLIERRVLLLRLQKTSYSSFKNWSNLFCWCLASDERISASPALEKIGNIVLSWTYYLPSDFLKRLDKDFEEIRSLNASVSLAR
jgi:hypothetical protein